MTPDSKKSATIDEVDLHECPSCEFSLVKASIPDFIRCENCSFSIEWKDYLEVNKKIRSALKAEAEKARQQERREMLEKVRGMEKASVSLGEYVESIHWDGAKNTLDWLMGLRNKITELEQALAKWQKEKPSA